MRVCSGGIIHEDEKLLILKPTYRDYWLLPGGHVETGESPLQACAREVQEETGLSLEIGGLLCVDFWREGLEASANGRHYLQPDDELVFLFDGGSLTSAQRGRIVVPPDEIEDIEFLELEDALALLAPYYNGRVRHAIMAAEAGTVAYLEGGQPAKGFD